MEESRGPTLRREVAVIAVATAGVLLLHLVLRGPGTALALGYMLALLVVLARGVPGALGAPRVGRAAAGALLALAVILALLPTEDPTRLESVGPSVARFPDARARAWQEIAPPSAWKGRGRPFVYVGIEGEPAEVASASAVLALEGRPLGPLEPAPDRFGFLRTPLPEEALSVAGTLHFSLGFERPTPKVGLYCFTCYWPSLDRAPSTFSEDGSLPPPGPPLVPRTRGPLDRLAGKAPFEQPRLPRGPGIPRDAVGRYAIELCLVGGEGRIVASCY